MDQLQFVVERLQGEPFNIAIRAVDFDDKTPTEHLQILNDVLASLSSNLKADLRVVQRDEVVEEMLQFLLMHKCKLIPRDEHERLDWIEGVRNGRKEIIYPILHWVLSNYENLRKREYLSKFLLPFDVPLFTTVESNESGNLEDLLEAYNELQKEFIDVHKHYEDTVANSERPASEILSDIKKMEEEERQMDVRLQNERSQARDNAAFQLLLAEASRLRQSQDNEIRLEGQMQTQLQSLASTQQNRKQARRLLEVIGVCKDQKENIINVLEEESHKLIDHLETVVITQRHDVETKLLVAEKESESDKPDGDVEYIVEMAAQLEALLNEKQSELESLCRHGKLASLQQDLKEALTKLGAIREDIDVQRLFKELLVSTNHDLRESSHRMLDGNSVDRQKLADKDETLKRQLEAYTASKQETTTIEESIVELKRTEEDLMKEHESLCERFRKEEALNGIEGYQDIQERMQEDAVKTVAVNVTKSKTLEEISEVVQTIAKTLEEKKQDLEPKMEELKQKRKQFQELQEVACKKKAEYEQVESKLTSDNNDLESDCSRLQEEWLQKERSYHNLCSNSPELGDVTKGFGMEHQKGGALTKEYISNQKAMFSNLKKLLELASSPSYE